MTRDTIWAFVNDAPRQAADIANRMVPPRWQVMDYAIVPQILPAFAGIAVFRWDINIRESAILGLVGAGGIGLQLLSSLNILAWSQVSLIFLVILVTVIVSEWVSAKVRAAIL